jgi:hypothetical protein
MGYNFLVACISETDRGIKKSKYEMYYICERGKQAVAGPSTRAILVILVSLLNRQLA